MNTHPSSKEISSNDPSNEWNLYSRYPGSNSLIEQLEALDDTIFNAVNGDPDALARAENQWCAIAHAADDVLVEESRVQYLRYANDIWANSQADRTIGPHQVTAALDIIALLTQ